MEEIKKPEPADRPVTEESEQNPDATYKVLERFSATGRTAIVINGLLRILEHAPKELAACMTEKRRDDLILYCEDYRDILAAFEYLSEYYKEPSEVTT